MMILTMILMMIASKSGVSLVVVWCTICFCPSIDGLAVSRMNIIRFQMNGIKAVINFQVKLRAGRGGEVG